MQFCVLLWGFTAIIGKLITLQALPLVFWRVLFVAVSLLFWLPLWRHLTRLTRHDWMLCFVAGTLVTLHWVCFYGSIKLANASVAATSIALAPAFLSILQPLFARQGFVLRELLVAVLSIPGVILVVGGIPADMMSGFAVGALAAFLVALFSLVNKQLAMRAHALALTAVEMTTGAVLLGLMIPFWPLFGVNFSWPTQNDLAWLLALAFVCTLLPFALSIVALRKLSAFSTQLAVNLEPVYAVTLAAIFLGENEQLDWQFYVGVCLILGAVVFHAKWNRAPVKQ